MFFFTVDGRGGPVQKSRLGRRQEGKRGLRKRTYLFIVPRELHALPHLLGAVRALDRLHIPAMERRQAEKGGDQPCGVRSG